MKLRWKILITVALAALTFWLFGCTTKHPAKQQTKHPAKQQIVTMHPDHRPTEGQLKDFFLSTNDGYFYGGLPATTRIKIDDLTEDRMGFVEKHEDGIWTIYIDRKSHPLAKQAEMTLIHEACHIEDDIRGLDEGIDGHNDNHEACMIRVASKHGFKGLW